MKNYVQEYLNRIHLTFFEGIFFGFSLLGLWLMLHYGFYFELQGIGRGFRIATLWNLCLFSFIVYRFCTNSNWFETIMYIFIQYMFYDTVWAYAKLAIFQNPQYILYPTPIQHYFIIYCLILTMYLYYKSLKHKPSFNIKKLLSLLFLVSIPIYLSARFGFAEGTYTTNQYPPNMDELWKWIIMPCFLLSRKKHGLEDSYLWNSKKIDMEI